MTQSMDFLLPRLDRLGKVAKSNKSLQFNNIFHHLNPALLHKAFYNLNRKAAKGVDDLGWFEYQQSVQQNIRELHGRLQSGKYKAQPVKRLWIPKPNGEERPIGITAIEDKIVQQALVWVLN
jgi:RNA-directed DNA polymerase